MDPAALLAALLAAMFETGLIRHSTVSSNQTTPQRNGVGVLLVRWKRQSYPHSLTDLEGAAAQQLARGQLPSPRGAGSPDCEDQVANREVRNPSNVFPRCSS
jgi:hypothetical protein